MIIECDSCKANIPAVVSSIKHFNITMESDGNKFALKALVCPKCGNRYPIRLDSGYTIELKKKLQKLQMQLSRDPNNEQLLNRFKQFQDELKQVDMNAFNRYNRSFYQDADLKERLELRLPVTKTGGEESNGKRSEQNT